MIEMQRFERLRTKICAIQYAGLKMDDELSRRFRNDLKSAYDYQQCRYLIAVRRGLKTPHTGDWLIFDETGCNLIDVMPDKTFRLTYESTDKPGEKTEPPTSEELYR